MATPRVRENTAAATCVLMMSINRSGNDITAAQATTNAVAVVWPNLAKIRSCSRAMIPNRATNPQ